MAGRRATSVASPTASTAAEVQVELVKTLQTMTLTSPLGYNLSLDFDSDVDVTEIDTNSRYDSPLNDICTSGIQTILDMTDDQFDDTIDLLLKARELYDLSNQD